MSSNLDRFIFLDNTDPSIIYNGPWSLVGPNAGIFGTLHGLSNPTGVASFSINYTGASIIARVFTQHGNDSTGSVANPILYNANCLIDGSSVSKTSQSEFETELTTLCGDSTQPLSPGTHTLEITLTFPSPNPDFGFYLSYVAVTPAVNQVISAQQNTLFIWDDLLIQQSIQQSNIGWMNQQGWAEASTQGSQFTFQFTGVSVIWFGQRPENSLLADTTATYTIDGGNPFSVDLFYDAQLPSHPGLFSTLEYPYGNHTLHVIYHGNSESVPLSLSALLVQGSAANNAGDVPQISTTSTTPTPSTVSIPISVSSLASASAPTQSLHHGTEAARVGGIVGGVLAFLIFVAVVIFYVWRRARSRERTPLYKPVSVDHLNSDEQTADAGLSDATPIAYGHDSNRSEMPWPQQIISPPQCDSPNPISQAEISSTSGMGSSDNRKGRNSELRIVQ